MKSSFLASVFLCVVFVLAAPAWGTCPEDPNDLGVCDSMYVEPWPVDLFFTSEGPYSVRVPIYVTTDVVSSTDSISAFIIPLCYTHTNPAKYCSVTTYWNSTSFTSPQSIFRHLDPYYVKNRMMSLYEQGEDREWNTRILDLDGTSHIWLAMIPTGQEDQAWWDGRHVLLATMTFKLQDTMQICIDTCFWPPTGHLAWSNPLGQIKVPRLGSEHDTASYKVCFRIDKCFLRGDVNHDFRIDVGDVVYLINYLYKSGPPPYHFGTGDVNDDGTIDVGDVVYLINYLFKGGSPPPPIKKANGQEGPNDDKKS